MPARITQQEYLAFVRQKYGPDLVVLEQYVNINTKINHKCTKCGDIRKRHPGMVMSSRTSRGKLLCCYQLPTTDSYIAELEARSSTLRPMESYRGRLKKIRHICLECKTESRMLPNHIIKGHGCFVCAKERQSHGYFGKKEVVVAGVTRKLQGFEPAALQYMIGRGANPKNIVSEVRDGKPTIKYRFEGKVRTFIPDFYHVTKNNVIEVKSAWTLGLSRSQDGGPFKKNAAKAKAAIAAGYNFTLLLMDRKGKRILLPGNWMHMTKAQVRKAVSA